MDTELQLYNYIYTIIFIIGINLGYFFISYFYSMDFEFIGLHINPFQLIRFETKFFNDLRMIKIRDNSNDLNFQFHLELLLKL